MFRVNTKQWYDPSFVLDDFYVEDLCRLIGEEHYTLYDAVDYLSKYDPKDVQACIERGYQKRANQEEKDFLSMLGEAQRKRLGPA